MYRARLLGYACCVKASRSRQLAIRLDEQTIADLDNQVRQLRAQFPKMTFNRSDVIRAAIADYLRRQQ